MARPRSRPAKKTKSMNSKSTGRPTKTQLSKIMKRAATLRERGWRTPLKSAWADFRAGKL